MPAFAPHQRKADAVRELRRGFVERPGVLVAALDGPEAGGLDLRGAQGEQVAARSATRGQPGNAALHPGLPARLCDVGDGGVRVRQVPEVAAFLRQLE